MPQIYFHNLVLLQNGIIRTSGAAITKGMPQMTRFSADGVHVQKKQRVLAKSVGLFERFLGLVGNRGEQ
ncbi:hypothetical protein CCB80_08660 [Armatimonadetes bacterium Uphvl-Ar1]|nr:hypothetical protein CCB80_08660 [Armatimonadetes bacterium Uphvl-Ar1]